MNEGRAKEWTRGKERKKTVLRGQGSLKENGWEGKKEGKTKEQTVTSLGPT